MFRSYFVSAYRSLIRYKFTTLINIGGLSIGIAAYFILTQFASFELSYDRFHHQSHNIYRIRHDGYKNGALKSSTVITYHALAPAIKDEFPEVENFTRLHRANGMLNHYRLDGTVVSQHIYHAFYADSSFFSLFDFPLVAGKSTEVLRRSSSMLISESAARKYFGDQNPTGKVMELTSWQGGSYIIEGVFKDIPLNSHMKFDFLFSIQNLLSNNQFKSQGWYWTNFYNYIQLRKGTDVERFEKKLEGITEKYLGKELRQRGADEKFILQPLTSIHLNSKVGGEIIPNQDLNTIRGLLAIAILIMGIAWVNYTNLTTATATRRLKEICVRKVMGSRTTQLIRQFLTESVMMSVIAVAVAAIIVVIAMPYFHLIIGYKLPFQLAGSFGFAFFTIPTIVAGMIIASLYPAIVISSFHPTQIFKGNAPNAAGGAKLRSSLVVLQFAAAMFLMIASMTVMRQLNFMKNIPLGIEVKNQLIVRSPRLIEGISYLNLMDEFKHEVMQSPLIKGVTISSEVPGKEIFWSDEFKELHEEESSRLPMSIMVVDDDFLDNYGIELSAGRNFSKRFPGDYGGAAIINETARARFGFEDAPSALGEQIVSGDNQPKQIIGVIRDFHQQSMKEAVSPLVLYFIPWENEYYTITIDENQQQAAIQLLASGFKKIFPNNAFDYFFLDDQFNYQYNADDRLSKVVLIFTAIALVIACLGLFALSSFQMLLKKKEVAIRKVLGASSGNIVTLLMSHYMKLVLSAILISAPVATYFVNQWLSQYAYRTNIPLAFFTFSAAFAMFIATATVLLHLLRSANSNPVESIRSE